MRKISRKRTTSRTQAPAETKQHTPRTPNPRARTTKHIQKHSFSEGPRDERLQRSCPLVNEAQAGTQPTEDKRHKYLHAMLGRGISGAAGLGIGGGRRALKSQRSSTGPPPTQSSGACTKIPKNHAASLFSAGHATTDGAPLPHGPAGWAAEHGRCGRRGVWRTRRRFRREGAGKWEEEYI